MAIAALDLPLIQPLRFVPQQGEMPQDTRNNLPNPDLVWFKESIRDWQIRTDYIQKWQFNDRIGVYVNAATTKGCTVAIIDTHGKIWHTFTIGNVALVATNQIRVSPTLSIPAYAYYANFRLSTIGGLPEGIYWPYLTVAYDLDNDGTPDFWRHNIGEPMNVDAVHPGTTHLDYYHSTNKIDEDVLFSILNVRFSLRVRAEIVDPDTDSEDTQNQDGSYNVEMLASQAFRTMKYALTERVPSWMSDKVKRAWGCDTVSVDNVAYTKGIGAKWDTNRSPKAPKIIASIPVQEGNKRQSYTQIVATAFPIYVQNNGLPYLVRSLYLTDGGAIQVYLTDAIIHDTAEETAYVTALNAEIAADGYAGSFSLVRATGAATLTWTNGAGDLFISGSAQLLELPFGVQYDSTNTAQSILFLNPNLTVDYGDGTSENISTAGFRGSTLHTWGSTGTQQVNIFGNFDSIEFDDGNLNSIYGNVPISLHNFIIKNSFTITLLDCTVFGSHQLQGLFVFDCSTLATISSFNTMNFSTLQHISFQGCNISSADASSIVSTVDVAINTQGGPAVGNLYINSQSPAAPLSGAGALAKSDLITNWGWNVLSD